jgi:carbonic anhydrase
MKIHQPRELIENADVALQMLKEGNERYLKGKLIQKESYSADRELLEVEQDPYAVILTCSDSRVSPEIFFDQKLGDIFVVRNAGNVADTEALGSIEYAIEHLKTKLVVVCGHTHCGAVTAACSGGDFSPNIRRIIDLINPALEKGGDIDKVTHNNVKIMVEKIKCLKNKPELI